MIEVDHGDVLEFLGRHPETDEVRWLRLKDRVVNCEVRIRFLENGSLDPLVAEILAHLRHAAEPMPLETLANAIGAKTRAGRRVTAEILTILARTNDIRVDDTDGSQRFALSSVSRWAPGQERMQDRVIERNFRFIPRSGQLEAWLPTMPEDRIEEYTGVELSAWWTPLDEEKLYSASRLTQAIIAACRAYYQTHAIPHDFAEEEGRIQTLQRSQLMSVDPKFLSASVISQIITRDWIVHKCYLYRSRAPGKDAWNIEVFRYRRRGGRREEGYTRYMRVVSQEFPGILENLLPISRTVTEKSWDTDLESASRAWEDRLLRWAGKKLESQ